MRKQVTAALAVTWLLAGAHLSMAPAASAVRDADVIRPGDTQILVRDATGHPMVARVALDDGVPAAAEGAMSLGGVWSFIIADGPRLTIFDVGPRHPLAWWLLPMPSVKGLVRRLRGNAHILAACERLFPGRVPTAIVFSHWHPDHTEDAPALQAAMAARFGTLPLLRIAAVDRPARRMGPVPAGAEGVFWGAGFRRGEWTWGPDLKDGEALGQSGFTVLALPGHTRGTVGLINTARKISIGPPPRYTIPRGGFWTESPTQYRGSLIKYYEATYGFRHYCTHPGRETLDAWPAPPWDTMRKRPAQR